MAIVNLPVIGGGSDPATITVSVLNGKVDPLATDYNGNIQNVNIAAGAGIVYSKLTLTDGIVNADINSSAAIADSKLATITTANKVGASAININGATTVTIVSTDHILIADASDSNNPKKGLASDIIFTPSTSNALSKSTIQTVFTKSSAAASSTGTAVDDDSIPTLTECPVISALNTAITASSTSNTLIITVTLNLDAADSNKGIGALFLDDATDAIAAVRFNTSEANRPNSCILSFSVSPADTSAHTYKIGLGGVSGSVFTVNGAGGSRKLGGVLYSTMKIEEIKA